MGPVEAAAYRALARKDRLDSPDGQLALALAAQMEGRVHSGSQLAAMSKEIADRLARALAGSEAEPDAVDEITARRAARAAGGHR